jgi:hypothetical protein
MGVKIHKNRHKIEAQFYEHNCVQGGAMKPEVDWSLPWVRRHVVPPDRAPGYINLDKDAQREVKTHFSLTQVGHFC